MKAIKSHSARLALATAVLFFLGPRGPALARGQVIVGQVLGREIVKTNLFPIVRYQIRLLGGYRLGLKAGTLLTLESYWSRGTSATAPNFLPLMARGTTFVCVVARLKRPAQNPELRVPGDKKVFFYHQPGLAVSPFGIPWTAPLPGKKVPQFVKALRIYATLRHYRETQHGARAMQRAWGLLLGPQKNYFTFALGTWEVARHGSKMGLRSLVQMLAGAASTRPALPAKGLCATGLLHHERPANVGAGIVLSEQRALWVFYCLRNVVPKGRRPPAVEIDAAMVRYLRNAISAGTASFVRWPG